MRPVEPAIILYLKVLGSRLTFDAVGFIFDAFGYHARTILPALWYLGQSQTDHRFYRLFVLPDCQRL